MTLVTNTETQVLTPGQSITFDKILFKSGEGECCRSRANRIPTVRLKKCGNYKIEFHGNIAGAGTTAIELAIAVNGVVLPETTMITTPYVANTQFSNVSAATVVANDGYVNEITVINNGTINIIVDPNSSLLLTRVSC